MVKIDETARTSSVSHRIRFVFFFISVFHPAAEGPPPPPPPPEMFVLLGSESAR